MKLTIRNKLAGAVAVSVLALGVVGAVPAFAAGCDSTTMSGAASCAKSAEQPDELFGDGGIFAKVSQVLLIIIGAVSVIMLIIGGIRYTISQGDQAAVKSAKDTILYSIIGIVVAILAYAAVQFVISNLAANGP